MRGPESLAWAVGRWPTIPTGVVRSPSAGTPRRPLSRLASARRRRHCTLACYERARAVLRGRLGRLMIGVAAFEIGNSAPTLLILRATEIFQPGRTQDHATQLALVLYIGYNATAALVSVPAGHHADRHGAVRLMVIG